VFNIGIYAVYNSEVVIASFQALTIVVYQTVKALVVQ